MVDIIKGKNVSIGKNIKFDGGKIILEDGVEIGDDVEINVTEKLHIKARSIIGKRFIIHGRHIILGEEFWSGHDCEIGGGSCFEKHSSLHIGYWGHFGNYGLINTARPVIIGNEVGLGTRTSLYTHGAYQSIFKGFPVEFGPITIEDNCWLPGATVLPNVTIGKNSVIGVGSVVTKNIPPGSLALGLPAKVVKNNYFPKEFNELETEQAVKKVLATFIEITDSWYPIKYLPPNIEIYNKEKTNPTVFNLKQMTISGQATEASERLRNQLRRYGVRFKYYPENGNYKKW